MYSTDDNKNENTCSAVRLPGAGTGLSTDSGADERHDAGAETGTATATGTNAGTDAGADSGECCGAGTPVSGIIMNILRVVGIAAVVLILVLIGRRLTLDDIMRFRMDNIWLASICLICAYAVKSIMIVVPLNLLMIAGGMFFESRVISLCVNTAGVAVCLTLPYLIGRAIGRKTADKFIKKYDKNGIISKIGRIQSENSFFISYIMRVIGFIPCDVLSIYMGACRISFVKYITGAVLGCVPSIITVTLVGASITEPGSPIFIISIALHLLLSVISSIIYRNFLKKRGGKQNGAKQANEAV